jgi:hypothetical protein
VSGWNSSSVPEIGIGIAIGIGTAVVIEKTFDRKNERLDGASIALQTVSQRRTPVDSIGGLDYDPDPDSDPDSDPDEEISCRRAGSSFRTHPSRAACCYHPRTLEKTHANLTPLISW